MKKSIFAMSVLLSLTMWNCACSEDKVTNEQHETQGGTEQVCPETCKSECDKAGNCLDDDETPSACPETCISECDKAGNCLDDDETPSACPETCKSECDKAGNCLDDDDDDEYDCIMDNSCENTVSECPAECPGHCDSDGNCLTSCPVECADTCYSNGTCPVVCPDACSESCDEKGVCPCPESCTTNSCDINGICQCPSQCAGKCNENGECPAMCGKEVLKKIYFANAELDLLKPGSSARTSTTTQVYVVTDAKTYNLNEAPCKNEIVVESSDTSVMTATVNSGDSSKVVFKSVGVGKATATAKVKEQEITGKITIHVLNLDRLTGSLVHKNGDTYSHLNRGPIELADGANGKIKVDGKSQGDKTTAQGFDFYNGTYMYFSKAVRDPNMFYLADNKTGFYKPYMVVYKKKPLDSSYSSKPMSFLQAGHGQNLIIENADGKDYVWTSNYGSLVLKTYDDGRQAYAEGYKHPQTISRTEFKAGKFVEPEDITEHYYYSDINDTAYYYGLEPALDIKNNKFGLRATSSKDHGKGKVYFRVFSLESAKSLPYTDVTLKYPRIVPDGDKDVKTEKNTKIKARDLGNLTPQFSFELESDKHSSAASAMPFPLQGVEFSNGLLYLIGGDASGKGTDYKRKSTIYIKVYSYSGSHIGTYYLRANTKLPDNTLNSKEFDVIMDQKIGSKQYYNIGYFEPEGIRVKDGRAYIEVSVKLCTSRTSEKECVYRHYVFIMNMLV